ncbi:integral membrane protein [Colletotrichum sublineola]|nr:integral membrane protein [Colletotrichum sublineola]
MKGYNTSFSPLPLDLRHGLEAVVAFSGLSFVTSSTLLIYLIGRLALWFSRTSPKRLKSSTQTGNIVGLPQELGAQYHAHASKKQRGVPNQFLVLLLNLLLADILQSCAFFLSVIWLVEDSIISSSPACWVQGWLLSMGDFATNAFVAAIAVHTYLTLLFALLTSVLGVIITNNGAGAGGFYVRDGAWYEILRVALHYIWMVLLIIAGIISYVSVFVHFHRKDKAMRETNNAAAAAQEAFADASLGLADLPPTLMRTDEKTDLKTRDIFLLYPLVSLLCTAPLALNHMMHSGGIKLSTESLVLAGVMVSSNGWLDVLVFSTTGGSILFESPVDEQNVGIDTFKFTPMDQQYGYRVWIHGGPPRDSQTPGRTDLFQKSSYRPKLASESRHDRGESQTSLRARDLSGLEGIQLETVTHVFVEEADNKITPMASEEPVGKRVQQSVDS